MKENKNVKKNSNGNKSAEFFYSTLSSKNQITVPSKIREKLDAYPGDQIIFSIDADDRLAVDIIKKDALLSLYGSMPPKEKYTQKEWADIRKEARKEKFNSDNN